MKYLPNKVNMHFIQNLLLWTDRFLLCYQTNNCCFHYNVDIHKISFHVWKKLLDYSASAFNLVLALDFYQELRYLFFVINIVISAPNITFLPNPWFGNEQSSRHIKWNTISKIKIFVKINIFSQLNRSK